MNYTTVDEAMMPVDRDLKGSSDVIKTKARMERARIAAKYKTAAAIISHIKQTEYQDEPRILEVLTQLITLLKSREKTILQSTDADFIMNASKINIETIMQPIKSKLQKITGSAVASQITTSISNAVSLKVNEANWRKGSIDRFVDKVKDSRAENKLKPRELTVQLRKYSKSVDGVHELILKYNSMVETADDDADVDLVNQFKRYSEQLSKLKTYLIKKANALKADSSKTDESGKPREILFSPVLIMTESGFRNAVVRIWGVENARDFVLDVQTLLMNIDKRTQL